MEWPLFVHSGKRTVTVSDGTQSEILHDPFAEEVRFPLQRTDDISGDQRYVIHVSKKPKGP